MKKIRFGTPEQIVPSKYCDRLTYEETDINYDVSKFNFKITARGCVLEFPLTWEEQIYGFGLQLKDFNHKCQKLQLRCNSDPCAHTGDSHAPVPFFVSTDGYGIYFDTARYMEVHCGFGKNKNRELDAYNNVIVDMDSLYKRNSVMSDLVMSVEIPVAKGVDIYLFEGETILDIVSQYNRFAGGGPDVPEWGLGILYRAYAKYTANQVVELAKGFRQKDIPCDVIGLEPGWQTNAYACSFMWDKERYPNYKEMITYLKENDFHINLWEHAFVHASSPIYKALHDYSGDYEVWRGIAPDFGMKEARDIFAEHHRKYCVDLGIDGFKLDECDNSDFVDTWSFPNCSEFPSGMDGEQYHLLFGTLYMQTMLQALGECKTLSQTRNAGALATSYPFVLYSDLYDLKDFVRGIVNSGFSGILWTAELRDAQTKKELLRRLQVTVFSVQCLINAWYCEEVPWKEFGCEKEVRELLKIRKSLQPMLVKAFEDYRVKGKPPIRALVADYTSDKETHYIDDQYIFCDDLIVAPLTPECDTRKVYLPEGAWRDYWTKEPVAFGWFEVTTENIPVYEKIKENI